LRFKKLFADERAGWTLKVKTLTEQANEAFDDADSHVAVSEAQAGEIDDLKMTVLALTNKVDTLISGSKAPADVIQVSEMRRGGQAPAETPVQHFTRGRSPPARNDDSTRHTNAAAASQPPSCGVQDPASQGGRENSEVNRLKAELQEAQDENKTMQGLYGRLQDRQQAERERADDPPEDYYDDHDDDAPPRRGGKAPAAADDEWWGDSSDEEHRFTRRKEGDKVQVPAFPTLTNLRNWKTMS